MLAEKAQELMLMLDFKDDHQTISKSFLKPISEISCFRSASLWYKNMDGKLLGKRRWKFLSSEAIKLDEGFFNDILSQYEGLPVGRWAVIEYGMPIGSFMLIALSEELVMILGLENDELPGSEEDRDSFAKALSFFGKFLSAKIQQENKENQFDELLLIKKLYKQAKAEAAEKEVLFRLVSENTNDLILLHQPNGDIIFASASAGQMLGYKGQEMVELSLSELIHDEDWPGLKRNFLLATGNTTNLDNLEFRAKRKDGSTFWVESSIKPIYNETGVLTQFQTISRDISKRKKAEILMIEEKRKAEAASQAKSDFLSTMSHEIRTPMNAVIGLSHLLMQENPRPDQLNSLRTLHFSAENLLSLINDILDYSKIEAGKITLENREYNLYELVDGIHRTFQPKAGDKNVKFYLRWGRQVPKRIIGDQVRLSQVLNNLISNALKFTEAGKVVLEIDLMEKTDSEVLLYFAVQDTGIGIPKEKQDKIFSRFAQANESTTRRYGGTGLGLAITKNLLELQGSNIELESEVGKGSRFFFKVRFKTVNENEATPDEAIRQKLESNELVGLRALVAEDNAVNRMIVERFLRKWGIQATFAVNGQEAFDRVKEQQFDIVLMDIHMPVMDGLQASKAIRKELKLSPEELPIVALTASTLAEDRKEAEEAGMDGYISKPFDPFDLFQKIHRHGKGKEGNGLVFR
ncbi:MAG: ATP-binding protein [Bacteroidia bacterium]|nr:ATP-binding protein [Bacteroidia bacterium]